MNSNVIENFLIPRIFIRFLEFRVKKNFIRNQAKAFGGFNLQKGY